jgi:Carboxypeptidase regulatory-like domain
MIRISLIRKIVPALILTIGLLGFTPLHGQSVSGTILGTVEDETGAAIPNATISVKNLGTGLEQSTTSDATGTYTISNLPVGHYSITVISAGFAPVEISDTELQVAQRATINPVLHVGGVSSQVEVLGTTVPLLNAASSSVSQVIDTQAVQNMPLNGRNFWQLTQLTPGVSYIQGGQNIAAGGTSIRASAVNVNVNGLSPSWTGWYLDGANITETQLGGTIISPNVDALQEFRVESGNMGADEGHTPTIINATLKSGTNNLHGTLYEFLRNNAFDAKNYFYQPPPGSTRRDEPLHRNQFGFVVGGPIRKNKTFFLLDMQETLYTMAQNFDNIVPSDAMRNGNFSASGLPIIKNPLTGVQVSSGGTANVIPTGLISSQAQYLLQFMPHANQVRGGISHAILTNTLKQQLGQGDIRVDHQLFTDDRLIGRYSISNDTERDPNAYPLLGGFPLRSRGQNALLRETHIFNAHWLNEAQFAYYRSFFFFTSSLQGTDVNSAAGITDLEGLSPPQYTGFPTINISNYSGYNGQAGNSYPKQNKIRSWQYVDKATYTTGKQEIRFGYENFHNTNTFISGSNSVGTFTFNGSYSGDNFADFLLGYPGSGSRSYFRSLWGNFGNLQAMYVQDNYHAAHNLTVNIGLRWEINPFYNAINGQATGLNPANGKLVIPSDFSINAQPGTPVLYPLFQDRIQSSNSLGLPNTIRPTAIFDVAPRLGFAYSPGNGNTVVRGGYGIFFLFPDTNYINSTQNSVPFVAAQTTNNSKPAPTLTFGNFYQGTPIVAPNTSGATCSFGFIADSCSTPNLVTMPLRQEQTYMHEYNVAVQHQFTPKISLDVSYVGNRTLHIVQSNSVNDPQPGAGSVQPRRPLTQWGTITLENFGGNQNFNSLQTKLETRSLANTTILVVYTYGKCLTDGTYASTTRVPDSSLRFYGPCNYDIRHNFVTSALYDLPFGKGHVIGGHLTGFTNGLVSNWNLSGIATLQSGLPFTTSISTDQANTGVGGQRPNIVGHPVLIRQPNCWFFDSRNTACGTGTDAFAVPALYTYGNGGINNLRSDGLVAVDMSIIKSIHFTDTRAFEFRGSFYNVFNHTTFASPSTTNIDSSSAGQITSTLNGSRQIELAAKVYF